MGEGFGLADLKYRAFYKHIVVFATGSGDPTNIFLEPTDLSCRQSASTLSHVTVRSSYILPQVRNSFKGWLPLGD